MISWNRPRFALVLLSSLVPVFWGCQSDSSTGPGELAAETPSSPLAAAPPLADDRPRLVLFLVVDQLRYDYLDRFRPLFQGGFDRLLRESVRFTDARYDHSTTSTAPGHATLATGLHPRSHGMVGNYWYDRDREDLIYGVKDDDDEVSPERLLATTFGEWLQNASPASKVFTAGGKDRSAVLLGGKKVDAAFWYDKPTGRFGVYGSAPSWLSEFNGRRWTDRYFGKPWTALPEVEANAEPYGLKSLDGGIVDLRFPHPLGEAGLTPDPVFYKALYKTPVIDTYLGELARAVIVGEELGADAETDFLGLSFSATDTVGHIFGPGSPEILDTLLRLDRTLAELLDFVDDRIGLDNTIVSLSADHGITEIPEVLQARGEAGRRFGSEEVACVQQVGPRLAEELGIDDPFLEGFYLDRKAIAAAGADLEEVAQAFRRELEVCPGIARVWTGAELGADLENDEMGRLFAHAFHPERSPDLMVQLEPHTLDDLETMTNHGSAYPYDTRVPWLLRLPEGQLLEVEERVYTVDVAPTLAELIGLATPDGLDGVDRGALFAGALTRSADRP